MWQQGWVLKTAGRRLPQVPGVPIREDITPGQTTSETSPAFRTLGCRHSAAHPMGSWHHPSTPWSCHGTPLAITPASRLLESSCRKDQGLLVFLPNTRGAEQNSQARPMRGQEGEGRLLRGASQPRPLSKTQSFQCSATRLTPTSTLGSAQKSLFWL